MSPLILFNNTIEVIFLRLSFYFIKNKEKTNKCEYLFISLSGLGDLVIAHLILNNDKLWGDKSYFIIDARFAELFNNYNGNIQIISLDRKKYKLNLPYRVKFIKYLRSIKPEVVVNLNRGRRLIDDQITILSTANSKVALSIVPKLFMKYYKKYVDKYYDKILFNNNLTEYEKLKNFIFLYKNKIYKLQPSLYVKNECSKPNEKYVVINPYSSNIVKDWSEEKYFEVIEHILRYPNIEIYIIGTTNSNKSIFNRNPRIHNLVNKTEIIHDIQLIYNSLFFIGGDSGFSHIAKAINKTRIIIVGGGTLGHYFPYLCGDNESLFYNKLECFGCEWNCYHKPPYHCLDIDISEVKLKIDGLLNN